MHIWLAQHWKLLSFITCSIVYLCIHPSICVLHCRLNETATSTHTFHKNGACCLKILCIFQSSENALGNLVYTMGSNGCSHQHQEQTSYQGRTMDKPHQVAESVEPGRLSAARASLRSETTRAEAPAACNAPTLEPPQPTRAPRCVIPCPVLLGFGIGHASLWVLAAGGTCDEFTGFHAISHLPGRDTFSAPVELS